MLNNCKENKPGKIYVENNIKDIATTETECIQLQILVEMMLNNLKTRKLNQNNWPLFEKREGFIVSKFHNIFKILSDITKNKGQKSMEYYRKRNHSFNKKSKIKYEEDKNIDSHPFQDALPSEYRKGLKSGEMKHRRSKKLDEVNEDNIQDWTNLIFNAVKDLTLLMKKERNSRLNLENLYQAFSTIIRINSKVKGNVNKSKDNKSFGSSFV